MQAVLIATLSALILSCVKEICQGKDRDLEDFSKDTLLALISTLLAQTAVSPWIDKTKVIEKVLAGAIVQYELERMLQTKTQKKDPPEEVVKKAEPRR